MKEKRLVLVKENIFDKIKNFFRNIFNRKKFEIKKNFEQKENTEKKESNYFEKNIIVKEDKEKTRLLKLQNDFSKGYITEEEMTEEDIEKLHELYDEQIEKIEASTELYKKRIIQIREKLEQYNS